MNPAIAAELLRVTTPRQLSDLKTRYGRGAVVEAWLTLPAERRNLVKLMAAFDGCIVLEDADVGSNG